LKGKTSSSTISLPFDGNTTYKSIGIVAVVVIHSQVLTEPNILYPEAQINAPQLTYVLKIKYTVNYSKITRYFFGKLTIAMLSSISKDVIIYIRYTCFEIFFLYVITPC